MRRFLPILVSLLALTGIACPPAPPPLDPPPKKDDKVSTPPEVEDLEGLKKRVEAALEQVQNRELLTTHGFWTIFHGILGCGPEKTMLTDPETRRKVRAIDYIRDGGELRGLRFLPTEHGLDVEDVKTRPDLQFVAQGHQDQFIAEMAQWGMDGNAPFKVAGSKYRFLDFANHSRMRASVTQNQELSWAIIIIAQYYGTDHEWINASKEKLRFEDVVAYEVKQPINEAACGGTHRLFGLTWAYHLHMQKGKKTGVWQDVEACIAEHKQKARKLQNPDRTFSTDYFKGPGNANDVHLRIGTTGHILEWLALAMTDKELREPWMQEAVSALSILILDNAKLKIDGGALYHATHGLQLYYDRVFSKPAPYLPLPPR